MRTDRYTLPSLSGLASEQVPACDSAAEPAAFCADAEDPDPMAREGTAQFSSARWQTGFRIGTPSQSFAMKTTRPHLFTSESSQPMSTCRLSALLAALAPQMSVPGTPSRALFLYLPHDLRKVYGVRVKPEKEQSGSLGPAEYKTLAQSRVPNKPRAAHVMSACCFIKACYATGTTRYRLLTLPDLSVIPSQRPC